MMRFLLTILFAFITTNITYAQFLGGCNGTKLDLFIPVNDSSIQFNTTTPGTPCGYSGGSSDALITKNYITTSGNLTGNPVGFFPYLVAQNNPNSYLGYASVLADSNKLFDTSLYYFKFQNDTTLFKDPNYVLRPLDFTIDNDSNYHILVFGYLAIYNYMSSCNDFRNGRLLHIKTNKTGVFLQFDVLDTIVDSYQAIPDFGLIATSNGIIQTEIKSDSLLVSFYNNNYQLQHQQIIKNIQDSTEVYTYAKNELLKINNNYCNILKIYKCDGITCKYITVLYNLDANGNYISYKHLDSAYDYNNWINENMHKNVFFFPYSDSQTIAKFTNSNNDTIKTVLLPYLYRKTFYSSITKLFYSVTDSFDYSGQFGVVNYKLFLNQYDSTGNLIYKSNFKDINPAFEFGYRNTFYGYDFFIDKYNNFIFQQSSNDGSGCPHGSSDYFYYSFLIFPISYKYNVQCKVYNDINKNCMPDINETIITNIIAELKLNGKTYYTTSDYWGNYLFSPYDTGHGKVILHLENQSTFTYACKDTFDVYISDTLQNPKVNFLVQTPNCGHATPKLNVEISTSFLRRCFDNLYTLTVYNESFDTAFNSYVDLELDKHLIATDTAFSSAQNLGNNTYRFDLGMVLPLQTIRQNLKIKVDCDSTVLGQTHCVKATAFPYETCLLIDLPRINVIALCKNDSVFFYIGNEGTLNAFNFPYRILENDSILTNGNLHFSTLQSADVIAVYNPSGKTLRLEGKQFPIYPNEDTIVSVTIEGCGNSNFSTGFVNLFSQDDDAPNLDIDCHQNVGSFDPNEKTAQPSGFGDSLYILPNTPIEYTIHFQNKGTYASYLVQITDTLSSAFDITTFQLVSSSHAFSYAIINSNILQFTSMNINLPAEKDDSLGSNGYIKFKILPKKNTANRTVIKNTASIIFDFNAAIITNTVIRNVNDDFLKIKIVSYVKNNLTKIKSTVYPNPFNQSATLSFDYNQPTQLIILLINGKIVQQYQSGNNHYTIDKNSLTNGLYLYELRNKNTNELLDTGKIIVQ